MYLFSDSNHFIDFHGQYRLICVSSCLDMGERQEGIKVCPQALVTVRYTLQHLI